jgi:Domain of unknown function (DUF1707)
MRAEAKVMTGPPGEAAPAGRGHLRASHDDREHVLDVLKAAFVQGRLTRDELDERLALVLASRTYAELSAITADLPVGLIAAELPVRPARARPPANRAIRSGLRVIGTAATLAAAAWAAAWLTGSAELFVLAMTVTIAAFGSVLLARAVMRGERRMRRSSGQLPPRPDRSGRASGRQRPAGPAGPLRQIRHGPHTALVARPPGLRPVLSRTR